jgi:hypothetical protein
MSEGEKRYTGGCLCGARRYEVVGEPLYTGHCYCSDCQKSIRLGFHPVHGVPTQSGTVQRRDRQFRTKAARGSVAVRNFCSSCGSLVFGGELGETDSLTI